MNNIQLNSLQTKIMAIPGMEVLHDAGFQIDESPVRDTHRTHFRFTSDGGVFDNVNGTTFTKYLREQGVYAEQRHPKLVVVENVELERVFNV